MSDVSGACAEASELIEIEMLYINMFYVSVYIYIYRIWCHCVKRFHVPSQDEDSYKPRFELLQLKSGAQSSREK